MRFLLALLLAAMPLSPAMAQGSWATSPRAERLQQLFDAVREGRAAEAIDLADPILAEYEKTYPAGIRVFCIGDMNDLPLYLDAAKGVERSEMIAIDTGWCFALWAKGYALVDLHRIDEAVPFLERAVAMEPINSQYLSELGNAYQELKQFDKALAVFTRAADAAQRLQGDHRVHWLTRAWRGMGFSLIELRRWDEAEALYRQCLELDPNDAKAKNELAYIAQQRPKR
ncbi:tetratricopeptide repeat protein [Sphingomonas sp. LB-2]|uniref:tetratricopeptide repeat protein n=1 Tax=Sphingomonas caeni TaxID=2984949 RepID=UPI0022324A9D|nr:tetratricopeptide repeat protein [Sphingomonas caeni]MCW3848754.1 tetratricopeptide repeat protein [Sphingomonas caeni]